MANESSLRLLARIKRKYQVEQSALNLAGMRIDFTRIADPNRVLDELAEREDRREKVEGKRRHGDELHLPYWAELWDSSLALSDYLPELFQTPPRGDLSLLDLGCGMGLVGTLAAALGASVILADLESDALLLARLNAGRFDPTIRAVRLNWRTDSLGQRFDWIIGADIIYERAQWEFLEPFWRKHLAPNGSVVIGEPNRPGGDAFPAWISEHGWKIEIVQRIAPLSAKKIRIMKLNCVSSAETKKAQP